MRDHLPNEEESALTDLRETLKVALDQADALPKSRQMALAITKIEEATHWLADLKGPAQ